MDFPRDHDCGFVVAAHGVFQSLDARPGFQRRGQLPGQDLAAEPIGRGCQIDEPAHHWDVGNVQYPNLIGACHR